MKNKVEQLRKERGLNQDDFAKMLRVSRQTISSIETGKYNPSLELAFAISDFFGKLWGDRIFEKCGIRRDEEGDGGKTLEIRGKRRLSARDGGANYQQS